MTGSEERLVKFLSAAGVASRRAAGDLVKAGRIAVNGRTIREPGFRILPADTVTLDGRPVEPAGRFHYIMLNKPRGYVCTLSDEKGRKTVAELVRDCGARVYPVGRLDLDSEGLLLLTNDGEWMQHLLHPRYEVNKVYEVSVAGEVRGAAEALASMTQLDGEPIRPAQVRVLRQGRDTAVLSITIHEGKNRQIRRMCAAAGLHVKRLKRVQEHALKLGALPVGVWRDLTEQELHATKSK